MGDEEERLPTGEKMANTEHRPLSIFRGVVYNCLNVCKPQDSSMDTQCECVRESGFEKVDRTQNGSHYKCHYQLNPEQ